MQQVNTENMYARMTECAVLIAVVLSLREGGLNFTWARKKKKKWTASKMTQQAPGQTRMKRTRGTQAKQVHITRMIHIQSLPFKHNPWSSYRSAAFSLNCTYLDFHTLCAYRWYNYHRFAPGLYFYIETFHEAMKISLATFCLISSKAASNISLSLPLSVSLCLSLALSLSPLKPICIGIFP